MTRAAGDGWRPLRCHVLVLLHLSEQETVEVAAWSMQTRLAVPAFPRLMSEHLCNCYPLIEEEAMQH